MERSRDWRAALRSVLAVAPEDDAAAKVGLLYTGVQQRCVSMAILVTVQFVLFDGLRAALAVSKEDLSLALDVFTDRVDFYSAWDEFSETWAHTLDELDKDLELPSR